MTHYIGDFAPAATIRSMWNSSDANGASITRSTNGTISVYKDGGTTQSTAGVTDTEDFDSLTGVHLVAIDTSADGTFYSAGSDFIVVLSAATIDTRTVNAALFSFSLNNRTPLRPTTAGRTLDVSAGGEAGVDWANVGSPTTTVGLSGTTVKTATDVETDTADIQSRLPAALVSGRIDASVGAAAANTLTASALAADAVTEIQSGLATAAALAVVDDFLDTEIAGILAAVDTEVAAIITALGTPAGASLAADIAAIEAQTDDIGTAGAGLTAVPWNPAWDTEVQSEAADALVDVGLTTTVTGRIDAAVTTRATPAQVNTEVLDCLVTDTHAELSAVPAATSSLRDKINWLFALARNKLTQTSSTQTLRNDADSGSIATAGVADDGTTASRAEWS